MTTNANNYNITCFRDEDDSNVKYQSATTNNTYVIPELKTLSIFRNDAGGTRTQCVFEHNRVKHH